MCVEIVSETRSVRRIVVRGGGGEGSPCCWQGVCGGVGGTTRVAAATDLCLCAFWLPFAA